MPKVLFAIEIESKRYANCGGGYVKGGDGGQQSILWGNVKMANCLFNRGVKMGTSGAHHPEPPYTLYP